MSATADSNFIRTCPALKRTNRSLTCVPRAHRTWLKAEELDFQVGDFVAVFYPKSYKATIYLAQVLPTDALKLQHWPENDESGERQKGTPTSTTKRHLTAREPGRRVGDFGS